MGLSFSTKIVVVVMLISVSSTQANARRLYKWVDQGSVTNYSEFQPKEGASRKVEVLESRGEHVDPAMMVTATYPNPVAPVTPATEKKEPQQVAQQPHAVEKKEVVANPFIEKPSSTVAAVEKKEDVVAVQPEKKVQPKINPWTRQVEFVPSNLVPQNLSKGSSNP